jgi:hypothetical protein
MDIKVFDALDRIICKLACLNQPLQSRPDYGTTGDMAERLNQIRKSLPKSAEMLKLIPTEEPPMPKVIVIEDYDEGKPEVVKQGPPCCPECGQEVPAKMSIEAHCMDHKFRRIRDTLRNSDLPEKALKVIHSNLDAIYKKYRELEEDKE